MNSKPNGITDRERGRPLFRGLAWHKERDFSFFRPTEWGRFEWLDGRQGVLYGPDPQDNTTVFAVEVRDIGLEVTGADLEDLLAGLVSGIKQLRANRILSQESWTVGGLNGVEAKYTFREQNQNRKRWIRVLYRDTRQLTVTAQGATEAEFDYWWPMFRECMMTFKVHPADWTPATAQEAMKL